MNILSEIIHSTGFRLALKRVVYYPPWGKKGSIYPLVVYCYRYGRPHRHPGLCDRLKALIGTYYIAVKNNMSFKIVCTEPLDLTKYLQPNKVNWMPMSGEVSQSTKDTQMMNYDTELPPPVLDANAKKQFHFYVSTGLDLIRANEKATWRKTWHTLYNELFKPTEHLENLLTAAKLPSEFAAVHIRFLNALDTFEIDYPDSTLSDAEKSELIERCLRSLRYISEQENGKPVIVFSDSKRFLQAAAENGFSILSSENVGHPAYNVKNNAVYDKIFTDLYTMSRSSTVWSVFGENLCNSQFAQYGSTIGYVPYKALSLENKILYTL